jgi:short-subunit dehydrogenase
MSVMTSAEVARAGYDGMMAGRSLVVPGVRNKIGVQSLRFVPRRVATKLVRSLNADA